mgnify:CR=1 FL=1
MKKRRLKRYYDLTFTISMTDKQLRKLGKCQDEAEMRDGINPEWGAGLAAVHELRDTYGVKITLEKWGFRRNDDYRAREP